jgi:hypothetical protein
MFGIYNKLTAKNETKYRKKQFKRMFNIFSLILVLVYPILPFLNAIIKNKPICNYDNGICVIIFMVFIFIVWCFWCVSWLINYIIFFIDDVSSIESIKSEILLFYFKYIWKMGQNKKIKSVFLEVLIVECFSVLLLMLIQINNIIFQ